MSKCNLPNWSNLPSSLGFLQSAAEKYGHYQFDEAIQYFLTHNMLDIEREELKQLSVNIELQNDDIQHFLDTYNMTTHTESRLIYFTLCLVSMALDLNLLNDK